MSEPSTATVPTPPASPLPKPAATPAPRKVPGPGVVRTTPLSVPVAHDITSLLLSLQGLDQRLSPYVRPTVRTARYLLTWKNPYASLLTVAVYCLLVQAGWSWTTHTVFAAIVAGLGFAYARRLGAAGAGGIVGARTRPAPRTIPQLLHSFIWMASSLHSIVDVIDSVARLLTFTRRSESASLGLFRAVLILWATVAFVAFLFGFKPILLVIGVLILAWRSDPLQKLRIIASTHLTDTTRKLGLDVQWIDEEDLEQEDDVVAKEAGSEITLRRASEVAARQLMGNAGPRPAPPQGVRRVPAPNGAPAAGPAGATVRRVVRPGPRPAAAAKPAAAGATSNVPVRTAPPVKKPAVAATPAVKRSNLPPTAPLPALVDEVDLEERKAVSDDIPHQPLDVIEEEPEVDGKLAAPTIAPAAEQNTTESKPQTEGLSPAAPVSVAATKEFIAVQRPNSVTSSVSSSDGTTDRLKSRLAQIVTSRTPPSSPPPATPAEEVSTDPIAAAGAAVDLKGDDDAPGLLDNMPLTPEPVDIDESGVTVDVHPDWGLPGDDDDYRRDKYGSLLRNRKRDEDVDSERLEYETQIEQERERDLPFDSRRTDRRAESDREDEPPRSRVHELSGHHRSLSASTIDDLAELSHPRNSFMNKTPSPRPSSSLSSSSSPPRPHIDPNGSFSRPRRASDTFRPAVPTSLNRSNRSASVSTGSSGISDSHIDSHFRTQRPHFENRTGSDTDHMYQNRNMSEPQLRAGRIPREMIPPRSISTTSQSDPARMGSGGRTPRDGGHRPSFASSSGASNRSSIRGSNRKPLNLVLSFETYENQRWWVGVGWVPHLLPTERGQWTDINGDHNLPKSSFDLPLFNKEHLELIRSGGVKPAGNGNSPTSPTPLNGGTPTPLPDDFMWDLDTASTRYAWDWDGPWFIDMAKQSEKLIDEDGWEYGDNFWSGWKARKTLKRVIRRRRWVRLARLFEIGQRRSVRFGASTVLQEGELEPYDLDLDQHQSRHYHISAAMGYDDQASHDGSSDAGNDAGVGMHNPNRRWMAEPDSYDDDQHHHHDDGYPPYDPPAAPVTSDEYDRYENFYDDQQQQQQQGHEYVDEDEYADDAAYHQYNNSSRSSPQHHLQQAADPRHALSPSVTSASLPSQHTITPDDNPRYPDNPYIDERRASADSREVITPPANVTPAAPARREEKREERKERKEEKKERKEEKRKEKDDKKREKERKKVRLDPFLGDALL
ncbi:uncharacterized protein EV422DRAFT_539760 [Fimicolochytrium jonesii]|uniref:uncharacterized protein n=1 Tax=Fimicolochytrium jonesii TaxID=1396493 RepID=UPI0022FED56F|nr:uncharacterized protein EV422DRAFT_539760 [Fimicolochytrium jonesii]KAI8818042.1 hypothetical protein EV422DRAFT_539760 [Fimicolochytrium jonesii]